MSHGLAALTAHAKDLVGAGDLGAAQMLLSDALAAVDVDPLRASADLADAAGLLARILVALGEPHSARAWATFAHTAQRRLRGPADERTVVAAATLAAVLHRVGANAAAAHLYRDVVARLTLVDGPGSMRVLAAQADLATVEHARGECVTARRLLADAYRRHRETYGEGHPAGIKMLARLGTMERDCGNFGEAHQLFSGARDLCREYLPAGHPMAAQIAALARASADPEHICRNVSPADDDFSADPPLTETPHPFPGTPEAAPASANAGSEPASEPTGPGGTAESAGTADSGDTAGPGGAAGPDSAGRPGSAADARLGTAADGDAEWLDAGGPVADAAPGPQRESPAAGTPWGTAPQRQAEPAPGAGSATPATGAGTPDAHADARIVPVAAGEPATTRAADSGEQPAPSAGPASEDDADHPLPVDGGAATGDAGYSSPPGVSHGASPEPVDTSARTAFAHDDGEPPVHASEQDGFSDIERPESQAWHGSGEDDGTEAWHRPPADLEPASPAQAEPASADPDRTASAPAIHEPVASAPAAHEPAASAPAAHEPAASAPAAPEAVAAASAADEPVTPASETPGLTASEAAALTSAASETVPADPETAAVTAPQPDPAAPPHHPPGHDDHDGGAPPERATGFGGLAERDDAPVVGPWHPPLQGGDDIEPWRAVSFYSAPRPAGADASGADAPLAAAASAWAPDEPRPPAVPESGAAAAGAAPVADEQTPPWRPPAHRPETGEQAAPWRARADRPEAWQPPTERGPSEPWPRGSDSGATPWTPPARTPPPEAAPTPRYPASGIPRSTPWVSGASAHPAPVPPPAGPGDADPAEGSSDTRARQGGSGSRPEAERPGTDRSAGAGTTATPAWSDVRPGTAPPADAGPAATPGTAHAWSDVRPGTAPPADAGPAATPGTAYAWSGAQPETEEPYGDWPLDEPPAWRPPDASGAWSAAPPATPQQPPGQQPHVPPQARPARYATPPTPVPYGDHTGTPDPYGDQRGPAPAGYGRDPGGPAPDERYWTDDGSAAPLPPAVFDDLAGHPAQAAPPAVAPSRHPVPAENRAPAESGPPAEEPPRGYAQRQARHDQPWRSQARGVRTPPPGGRYSPLAPGYGQPGQPQIKAHRRTQGDRSLTAGPAAQRHPAGMLVPARRVPGLAPERYPERPTGKIVAALVAVGLGTVVVIGGFLLTERDTRETPPPAPTASPPSAGATPPPAEAPARAGGGPPSDVRIQDSRTQVTLTWTYPENAEGPVVLTGGRRGNSVAIEELPAGSEQYPVYNLNPDADYCFTVAIVYSTSQIEKAPEVCTTR
ncbi:tetratricopeptide repeat protein [Catenuloplanes indicus]|uniref:tetratricopeptide repeat protein n=1 Tax=Catenuloplanes indicus TaxID=137267 RepID=UPI0027D85054|nr:tetratricopeptide repeat protein [Catenuloplanes indicus]